MALTPCLDCGTLTRTSRCDRHRVRNGSTRTWRDLRRRILQRDSWRCTHLDNGERCTETTNLHVDHRTPKANGGTDNPANLTTLCERHNLQKGKR